MRKEEINDHTIIGPGLNGYAEHSVYTTKENAYFAKDEDRQIRPWGHYTILDEGPGYKVKKIVMNPGGAISLQKHHHRSENWSIISGVAKIEIEDREFPLYINQSTYINVGEKHRCTNIGKIPLWFIEVQTGPYTEEDDIERFGTPSTFGDIL